MKALSAEDKDDVQRFLESIRFRHGHASKASIVYRGILRGFLRFIRARSGSEPPCEETMHAWLVERRQHSELHKVVSGAQLVDRFLDWMKASGRIASNPFQDLRGQYGQRTAPLVRAMLSTDPQAALEQLRPLPVFGSGLGPVMRDHIALMRSLGHRYIAAEEMLLRFDR